MRGFLDETRAAPPPWWTDPRFCEPTQPVVGTSWFDAVAYCDWLSVAERRAPPAADRGRVGEGRARRAPGRTVSLGAGAPGHAHVRSPAPRHRHARQPARHRRALGRMPRVVPRLGRLGLLCGLSRPQSAGPRRRHSPNLARRRLAPSRPVEPGGPSLVAAAGAAIFGLRLPSGARGGSAALRTRPRRHVMSGRSSEAARALARERQDHPGRRPGAARAR